MCAVQGPHGAIEHKRNSTKVNAFRQTISKKLSTDPTFIKFNSRWLRLSDIMDSNFLTSKHDYVFNEIKCPLAGHETFDLF